MKYQIGDKVVFVGDEAAYDYILDKNEVYEIIGTERTITTEAKCLAPSWEYPSEVETSESVLYTIKAKDSEEYYAGEEDLALYKEDFKRLNTLNLIDGEEYELKTGLVAKYDKDIGALITEDGIKIPKNLYNFEGKCLACDDFDIVSKNLYTKTSTSDEITSIRLASDDGKYWIKFDTTLGVPSISGQLPENIEDTLIQILNVLKKGM